MNLISNHSVLKILTISKIVLILFISYSCTANKEWQTARVVYSDDFEKTTNILAKKSTYFTFIRAKSQEEGSKIEILIPAEVKFVDGKDSRYVGMFFDEENYGMETWSFGRVISGDSIMLTETRFQFKTCACKTAGKYFHGYFLVYGYEHLKISTDSKNNVYNRSEIYNFIDKFSEIPLPKEINTIDDLGFFLKNINN